MAPRLLCRSALPLFLLAACTEHPPSTAPGSGLAASHADAHLVVNSLVDPGDGTCDATQCTLREAIVAANLDPAPSEISFARKLTGTITLAQPNAGGGQLLITEDLVISAPAERRVTVQRASTDPEFRIIDIALGATVTLNHLVIRGGAARSEGADEDGGGIRNRGALTLRHSTVSGNSALDPEEGFQFEANGGGIDNRGTLTLEHSTVAGNSSDSHGGGISNRGTLTLLNSTVSGNTNQDDGGGIENASGSTLTLEKSTVSGNLGHDGGGITNEGTATLRNSTVSGNWSDIDGGGILNWDGLVTLENTTIAFNRAMDDGGGIATLGTVVLRNTVVALNTNESSFGQGPDICTAANPCGGVATASFSLIGNGDASGLTDGENNNQVGSGAAPLNPKLAELAKNGGTTASHALQPGSPAIDTGTLEGCPATDQRGVARPQGLTCDIGSYERKTQKGK